MKFLIFSEFTEFKFSQYKSKYFFIAKVALEIKIYWHMWAILTEFSQEGTYIRIIFKNRL